MIRDLLCMTFPRHVRMNENTFVCGALHKGHSIHRNRRQPDDNAFQQKLQLQQQQQRQPHQPQQSETSSVNSSSGSPPPPPPPPPPCATGSPTAMETTTPPPAMANVAGARGKGAAALHAHGWFSPTREGKRTHIDIVCEEYNKARANIGGAGAVRGAACDDDGDRTSLDLLTRSHVLLIDDDKTNIVLARKCHTRAVWFQAQEGLMGCEHMLLQDLLAGRWN